MAYFVLYTVAVALCACSSVCLWSTPLCTFVEPPRIVSTSQRQNNLEQGEHVQLFCNATGFPEPKIKWTRKGRKLPNGHREHHGSELHFSHVGPKHSGDYVCSATNALGTVHHNFVLTVSAGPEVDFDKDVYNTNVGRTVEIGCIVHAYPPATVRFGGVTWQLNNGVVQGSRFEMFKDQEFHSGSRHVLRIHQVVDTDFGTYRCLAENERGTARRVVQLSGLPTPARLDEVTYEKGRPVLLWTVESLSPVDKYELMYRRQNEWTSTRTPTVQLPVVEGNIYKVKYELRDVETADYEAKLKAHNLFGWSELSQKYPFSAGNHFKLYVLPPPD
ncbi:hypothetical protein ONE63_002854 [Megalurothrips usitatus]|uniref:Ig-like domain-containing protein n=1 Tax=Megalurothrips usitatus TaxID=439358 RepID=A0AAV7XBI5_9NEOP|nr:hypothetical protein ONE63_002854 [Megalurothrips usitatus]